MTKPLYTCRKCGFSHRELICPRCHTPIGLVSEVKPDIEIGKRESPLEDLLKED